MSVVARRLHHLLLLDLCGLKTCRNHLASHALPSSLLFQQVGRALEEKRRLGGADAKFVCAGEGIMSLIQDMYKDGDGDTRRAISQAWDKVGASELSRELDGVRHA